MTIQPLDWPTPVVLDPDLLRQFMQATASEEHYYTLFLGLQPPDTANLIKMLEEGLPYTVWESLIAYMHVSQEALLQLTQIPRRTLYYRKQAGRFKSLESERLLRVARVFGEVLRYYGGDLSGALRWLFKPQRTLYGKTPFEMARTEAGAREVEDLIYRRAHGVVS